MREATDFSMEVIADGPQATIWLAGNIDVSNADQVTELGVVTASADFKAVVLDMSQVGFIDSTGIGAMIRVRQAATERGVEFRLRAVSSPVAQLLDLTGLLPVFDLPDGDAGRC